MSEAILSKWEEVKVLVDSLELDVHKNAKGNSAAGVRTRKGLRGLKKAVGELVKLTVAEDRERRAAKAATKKTT